MVLTRSKTDVRLFIPFEKTPKNSQKRRDANPQCDSLSVQCDQSLSTADNSRVHDTLNSNEMSSLSLPTAPFNRKDPASWFRQLEAIFLLSNVTDDAVKFAHLQARIDPTILHEVSEFFTDIPATNKYDALKDKVMSKYTESRDAQVLQLLEGLTLGDSKPSELLGEFQRLAGTDVSDNVLRTMFIKKLPEKLAIMLAGSTEPLINLGKLADKIYTFLAPQAASQIAAFSASPLSTSLPDAEVRQLKAMLSALIETNAQMLTRIATLEASFLAQGNQRTPHTSRRDRSYSPGPRRRSTARNSTTMPEDSKLCYYHYRFMGKAVKCTTLPDGTPCKWDNLNR